ncbi:Restriction endonuclease-like protein, partial [Lentisphaera araneosa HTCC2155]
MNKFKQAAIAVLQESGEALHYREITKRALQSGLLETDGRTPEASMNAQISTEIKLEGNNSTFVKIATATFSLNPNPPSDDKPSINAGFKENSEKVGSGFIGKAGE